MARLIKTISGENIYLNDTKDEKVIEYALYGKAIQKGEPTPQNPIEIEVSGASGSVDVKSVGKNLLVYPYLQGTNTHNGITYTDNGDGSVTLNGTATANAFFNFIHSNSKSSIGLKQGDKIKVTCKNMKASGNGMLMAVILRDANDTNLSLTNIFDGEYTIEVPENYSHFYSYIYVANGTKVENLTIYPMIRYATDTDSTWQPYRETLSTIPTPNGLAGIKVSSNGNYTDQNGQQWICDEVVKYADGSGAYIQRIASRVYDGVKNVCGYANPSVVGATETLTQVNLGSAVHWTDSSFTQQESICDKAIYFVNTGALSKKRYHFFRDPNNGIAVMYLGLEDGVTDIATANAWLQENNVTVYYILKEPITTPLTAEEIAEISTFYPVTNISNDFDCGMKITYYTRFVEWETPKTDWKETDRFNIQDFNRIKNNIMWLYEKAVYLNRPFDIEDMGEDIVDYLSYWKVSSFNAFEDNIETINNNILTKDYGTPQRFYENSTFIKWTELNRIESAILSMKNILDNHEKGLRKIPFVLGRFKDIRV